MRQAKTFAQAAAPVPDDIGFAEIQPGLSLQRVDLRTRQAMTDAALVPRSLSVSILLQGEAEVRFDGDGRRSALQWRVGMAGDRRRAGGAPQASIFSAVRPIEVARRLPADMRLRHLSILASPDWLERSGLGIYPSIAPILDGRDTPPMAPWAASHRLLSLAEQLLRPTEPSSPLQRLHRESRVLELLAQAIADSGAEARLPPPLRHWIPACCGGCSRSANGSKPTATCR